MIVSYVEGDQVVCIAQAGGVQRRRPGGNEPQKLREGQRPDVWKDAVCIGSFAVFLNVFRSTVDEIVAEIRRRRDSLTRASCLYRLMKTANMRSMDFNDYMPVSRMWNPRIVNSEKSLANAPGIFLRSLYGQSGFRSPDQWQLQASSPAPRLVDRATSPCYACVGIFLFDSDTALDEAGQQISRQLDVQRHRRRKKQVHSFSCRWFRGLGVRR